MTINCWFTAPKIWGQASLDQRGTLQQWQYIKLDNITTTARPGITKVPTIIPWQEAYSDEHKKMQMTRSIVYCSPWRFVHPPLVSLCHQDLNPTKDVVGKCFEDLNTNLGVLLIEALTNHIHSEISFYVSFHLNFCSQLIVLLHDVVHVVLRHVCPLVRLLWDNVVWKISNATCVLIARLLTWDLLPTRVVVGAGVVKTQLGGVQETRVSSPVRPNTLRMYLDDAMWIPSNHGFQNLTGTRNRMGRHQSWCQSEVEGQKDDRVF